MINNCKYNDLKYLLWIIPLAGIIVGAIFIFDKPEMEINRIIINISGSVIYTAVIWLGCRALIPYIQKIYPWEKHPIKHIAGELAFIIFYTLIITIASYFIYSEMYFDKAEEFLVFQQYFITLIITLFVTSIYEGIYIYRLMKENLIKSEKLQRANLEAQYETLKNQDNPHFLFNSLNTLLSYVEDNTKARE